MEGAVQALVEAYSIYQEQMDSVKEANQIFAAVRKDIRLFVSHLDAVSGFVRELEKTQSKLSESMGSVSTVALATI